MKGTRKIVLAAVLVLTLALGIVGVAAAEDRVHEIENSAMGTPESRACKTVELPEPAAVTMDPSFNVVILNGTQIACTDPPQPMFG